MPDPSPPPKSPNTPGPPQFECELRSGGRAASWIRLSGEADRGSAPQFEQALQEGLSRSLLLVIDLRELTFIDSTGLHLIIKAKARARSTGRRLVFVRGSAQIDCLFELIGLSAQLEIIDVKPPSVMPRARSAWPPHDQHEARFRPRTGE